MAVPKPPKTATNRDVKPERNKGVSKPVPLGGKMAAAKPKDKGSMPGAKAPAKKPMGPAKTYNQKLMQGATSIKGFAYGKKTQ
jgi:hypothetical protein